jgi:hypothetical protein
MGGTCNTNRIVEKHIYNFKWKMNLGVYGSIILKWTLNEEGVRMWTLFIWFRI